MNLKVTLSSILFSLSFASFAQLKDTVSVKSNSFYEDYFTELSQNPLYLSQYKIKDFTQTQVEYQNKNLKFKRRQTAGSTDAFRFTTQGIYNYSSKLRVFGNFAVSKILEDDLGFNFSSKRTEDQIILAPNYYYAPKAGNWDTQKYALEGGATYSFDNGLLLGTVINYANEKHYRKVDPRPEILVHNLFVKGFLGYTYKQHKVNGYLGIGKNTEESNIIYVDKLLNAPTLEDTFIRFNSGYGYNSFNASYNNYMFRGITNLWGAGYQFNQNKNSFTLNYQYSKLLEDLYQKTILTSGTSEILLDKSKISHKYRDITHLTNFSYKYDGDKVDFASQAYFKFSKKENYSLLALGQNFRYVENTFGLDNKIIKRENGRTQYAFNFGAKYSRNIIKDLLTVVDKKIHYLELSLNANTDLFKNERNRINTEVYFKHYNSLSNHLNYNASGSNTTFGNQVITNDHGYDVTSKLTTGLQVNYDITFKKCDLRIFGLYQSLFATGQQYKEFTSNLINKPNQTGTIGLAIIY